MILCNIALGTLILGSDGIVRNHCVFTMLDDKLTQVFFHVSSCLLCVPHGIYRMRDPGMVAGRVLILMQLSVKCET